MRVSLDREQILARKRREYRDMVPQFYDVPDSERSDEEVVSLRQVCLRHPSRPLSLLYLTGRPVDLLTRSCRASGAERRTLFCTDTVEQTKCICAPS